MPVLNKKLRKLYGRAPNGERSREIVRATITKDTMDLVREMVEIKKGGYGSALIELSLRLMIILLEPPRVVKREDIGVEIDGMEFFANELEHVIESPYFQSNMEKLARLLKQ